MPDIARPTLAVYWSRSRSQAAMFDQLCGNSAKKIVKSCPAAHGNIVNLIACFRVLRHGGQKVRLNDVGNVTEVAAGLSVSIDIHLPPLHQSRDPTGNYGCVRASRVLSWSEYIEVSEAN